MTFGDLAALVVQTIAVAVAAFAAGQAKSSANASHDAVKELRAAREQEARSWRLQRLESIRQVVIRMKDLAAQGQEGSKVFRTLQTNLRAALPPPVGTPELLVCLDLANANRDEVQLASLALSEIENVRVATREGQVARGSNPGGDGG